MQAGSTTDSNYTKMARPATKDAGITTIHDRYVSLVRRYYSGRRTIQTTRPSRHGTTDSGLASALGLTSTSWALPPVSTALGPFVDYRSLTDTIVNYLIRSRRPPGRLTVSVGLRPLRSYYLRTVRAAQATPSLPPRRLPLSPRSRSKNYHRSTRRDARQRHHLHQVLPPQPRLQLQRLQLSYRIRHLPEDSLDQHRLLRPEALTITSDYASHLHYLHQY